MKIYLARPISGCNGEEVFKYYEKLSRYLHFCGYSVLCPMTGKEEMRTENAYNPFGYKNPLAKDKAIKSRDQWMVLQSDVVLLDLSESKEKSIGCMMELAWADLANKHTVVILPKGNVHEHAFVHECADIVFETLPDAKLYLERLIGE